MGDAARLLLDAMRSSRSTRPVDKPPTPSCCGSCATLVAAMEEAIGMIQNLRAEDAIQTLVNALPREAP